MKYDVIIIGGGAGGLSAGLWCDEVGFDALLLESGNELGGQLLWTYNAIENHLGVRAANGHDLRDRFVEQLKGRRFTRRMQAEAAEIDAAEKNVRLTNGESFSSEVLIVATGVRRRKLNIAGEDEFIGRGMLRSGKLDRDSVAGQTAIVVGGGDAALENALILAGSAAQVFVVHRRDEIRAREEFVARAARTPNIKFLTEMVVTGIFGTDHISNVCLKSTKTGEISDLAAEAVVIRIGVEPNTEFLRGQLDLDESGYIKINSECRTSASGVFAVGDVANPVSPTVSSAVGMGAISVKSAHAWLNR